MKVIDEVIAHGTKIRTRLREVLERHGYRGDTKNLALMGYAELALEHHKAIWLLIDAKLYGSAFAMLRPLYDVMLRGYWINNCASAEQIEAAFYDDDIPVGTKRLLADIKRDYLMHVHPGASNFPPRQADQISHQLH